jgi:1-acyl-sn-glycerol-3-phosphate acyltransferase
VLFPEGTRRSGPVVEDVFDGAAYVALRTGAPIVPVGIGGSERAMPKGAKFIHPVKVRMVIGKPLHPPATEGGARAPRRAVRELTVELQKRLQDLFDEAQSKAAG